MSTNAKRLKMQSNNDEESSVEICEMFHVVLDIIESFATKIMNKNPIEVQRMLNILTQMKGTKLLELMEIFTNETLYLQKIQPFEIPKEKYLCFGSFTITMMNELDELVANLLINENLFSLYYQYQDIMARYNVRGVVVFLQTFQQILHETKMTKSDALSITQWTFDTFNYMKTKICHAAIKTVLETNTIPTIINNMKTYLPMLLDVLQNLCETKRKELLEACKEEEK